MNRSEQFEGRNLEDALNQAAERVGCRKEDLQFEVVREERGFLGAEGRSIAVRVELPDAKRLPSPVPAREPAAPPAPSRSTRQRTGPRPERVQDSPAVEVEERELRTHEEEEPTGPDPSAPQVLELVRELLTRMGLDAQASMSEDQGRIHVDVTGADRDLVLGEEGATLDALQYIVNRIAERELNTVNRVQLESDGFRLEREEEVREMALAAAEQVRRTGAPMRLPPLNPYERRIVHVTLSGKPGVATESEGGGFVKRVVVLPLGRGGAPSPRPARPGRERGHGNDRRRGGRG